MKYIKIPKIQISGLPPQRRITRKLNECSFGPCSRFWHQNLSTVHQDAKIADMHRRSRNRAVSRMIVSHVLICINVHTAMHSDRFLAAEIEIAKSARCQTMRARAACSRYRRKLSHIPESVRHSQRFSGWNLKLTLFGNNITGISVYTARIYRYLRERQSSQQICDFQTNAAADAIEGRDHCISNIRGLW